VTLDIRQDPMGGQRIPCSMQGLGRGQSWAPGQSLGMESMLIFKAQAAQL
jgi:hypothetical protein